MKKNIIRMLLIVGVVLTANVNAKSGYLQNTTIIVSSCDKYSQLWDPFFASLFKNWDGLANNDMPIILIANQKKYPNARIKTVNIPNEKSWSENMEFALDKVKTKYVLLFLDDYWVNDRVNIDRLNEILHIMSIQDIAYMQLYADVTDSSQYANVPNVKGITLKNKFQKYRASLQLAIWETKALKQILREGEDAWDFELAASIRSAGYPKEFASVRENLPISYLNAVHRGHIEPLALEFAKQNNIVFRNTMPIRQDKNWRQTITGLRSKASSFYELIKRNLLGTHDQTYRYKFEN